MTCALLLKGASPVKLNGGGASPLDLARILGHKDIEATLVAHSSSKIQLEFGYSNTNSERSALNPFIQPNIKPGLISSSYLAFWHQQPAKELVNLTDKNGATALMKASSQGHLSIVVRLIQAGADLGLSDKNGWDAMCWACNGGHLDIVRKLVEKGGNVNNDLTEKKNTPLIAAIQSGQLPLIQFLLSCGARLNDRVGSGKGKSAIMFAAWIGRQEVIRCLLQPHPGSKGQEVRIDSNPEGWIKKGLIHLKKVRGEGPWDLGSSQDVHAPSSLAGKSAVVVGRRLSSVLLKEKLFYFTSEENERIVLLANLLARKPDPTQSTPEPAQATPKTFAGVFKDRLQMDVSRT